MRGCEASDWEAGMPCTACRSLCMVADMLEDMPQAASTPRPQPASGRARAWASLGEPVKYRATRQLQKNDKTSHALSINPPTTHPRRARAWARSGRLVYACATKDDAEPYRLSSSRALTMLAGKLTGAAPGPEGGA